MQKYSAGDIEAFNVLYTRNKAPLYRYFLRQTQHSNLAEDLGQDVWTKIIHARANYQVTAKFTTYLYQIAHNRLIDHFRRMSHRIDDSAVPPDNPQELLDHHNKQPDALVESHQKMHAIIKLVNDLPAEQREAFVLKQDAGLSVHEIATITDTKAETVKTRLRYALAKLREGLAQYHD